MTSSWPHHPIPQRIPLPSLGHLPAHEHIFEEREVWAIRGALGARRPLLVRGEPGTGKSELARAAAEVLNRPLVTEVISARTESSDLLYRFDAVARLGQAQLLGAIRGSANGGNLDSLSAALFVEPGPLWWVFDWNGAEAQCNAIGRVPLQGRPGWSAAHGTVLLIDEIDKADPDLPNGLLECLGNGQFSVPYLREPIRCYAKNEPPLIIITTNEERELPAAFVRRCMVLHLALPTGAALQSWLTERGRSHFGQGIAAGVYESAAKQLVEDREILGPDALVRPGQAEYLDLLRAVKAVAKGDLVVQSAVLEELSGFALRKSAPA